MERGKGKTSGPTTGSTGTLLPSKTYAQSEPDIIPTVAARRAFSAAIDAYDTVFNAIEVHTQAHQSLIFLVRVRWHE